MLKHTHTDTQTHTHTHTHPPTHTHRHTHTHTDTHMRAHTHAHRPPNGPIFLTQGRYRGTHISKSPICCSCRLLDCSGCQTLLIGQTGRTFQFLGPVTGIRNLSCVVAKVMFSPSYVFISDLSNLESHLPAQLSGSQDLGDLPVCNTVEVPEPAESTLH